MHFLVAQHQPGELLSAPPPSGESDLHRLGPGPALREQAQGTTCSLGFNVLSKILNAKATLLKLRRQLRGGFPGNILINYLFK